MRADVRGKRHSSRDEAGQPIGMRKRRRESLGKVYRMGELRGGWSAHVSQQPLLRLKTKIANSAHLEVQVQGRKPDLPNMQDLEARAYG
jgi:hypothetical protein